MDTSVYLDNSKEATSLYAQLREAQAEVAWLRAALTDAVMTVGQSRKSHLGDHYSYCPQISEQRLEKWRGVLAKPHSVSPSVTNRENDKQPQCGHPRAAISGGECTLHCRWCEDVEAARKEGSRARFHDMLAPMECGHPNIAWFDERQECEWCREVEAARAEGAAAERERLRSIIGHTQLLNAAAGAIERTGWILCDIGEDNADYPAHIASKKLRGLAAAIRSQ